jgi:hypothetical protein
MKRRRKHDQGITATRILTHHGRSSSVLPRVEHQQQATTLDVEHTRMLLDAFTPVPGQINAKLSIEI